MVSLCEYLCHPSTEDTWSALKFIDSHLSGITHGTLASTKDKSWAQDLDNINVECVQDLSTAFEDCQDGLNDDQENIPLDFLEQRLEQTFELLRAQTNKVIDESKAKAKKCFEGVPVGARKQAMNWFMSGMQYVMNFFGFLRNAITQLATRMKHLVKSMWQKVLTSLRIRVATRALTATSQIRRLPSANNVEGIRLEVLSLLLQPEGSD